METIHVKITTSQSAPPFQRQIPNKSYIWDNIHFHICDDFATPDAWFVIDDLPHEETVKINKKNIFLSTGEPPFVKLYSGRYTKQFSKVLSCQKNVYTRSNGIKAFPLLPWMAGAKQEDGMNKWSNDYLDYNFFHENHFKKENDKIAIITSNKRGTKGHNQRFLFVEKITKYFPDIIELYGNGFKPIADKFDVYSKYKYVICIENCSYPSYWTEKIADAYLCEAFPLYYGAPDLNNYFPQESYTPININDSEQAIKIIQHVLENNLYEKNYNSILQAKKLVLNKYNMLFTIKEFIKQNISSDYQNKKDITILPLKDDLGIKILRRLHKYFKMEI